ncbi:MAG: hypothetical protein LQ344_007599 [Seirophora lacunosa]|nr:MAG: hypothetical protein LQ344_007599 [Seirophora lacunosa]
MARLAYNNNSNIKHSNPPYLRIDPKPHFADDEADCILDDAILERRPSETSARDMGHQRENIAVDPPTIMSSRDSRWSDFTFPAESAAHLQSGNMTSPLFFEQGGQAYVQDDSVSGTMYNHPSAAAWQAPSDQDSCTPTTSYDVFPSDQDAKAMVPFHHDEPLNHPPQSMYGGLPLVQPSNLYSGSALSTSPRSAQDWSSISSADHVDFHPMHRPGPLSSPNYNPNPPLLRRDGIRKKNARFEIPAERTLRTIDQMISQTTDEAQIKELKQQKRLLRNRQAALDSRQRKKQHTERLEEEKKHTSSFISELEDSLAEMRIREEQWTQEREQMRMYQLRQKQCIDELMAEKEELVRRHTIETAELRKKNTFLAEHAQKIDSIAMSAVPSSTGYSADYSDFEHLTMESSQWDSFSLVTDFNMEPTKHEADHHSLLVAPKKENNAEGATTAASGLLLMLLLCGAWVVSNSTSTTSGPISRMPEDIRMASTAVLDTLYSDTGVQPHHHRAKEGPSRHHPTDPTGTRPRSPLSALHRQLISPSEQQQRDHLFSLSAHHYNGVTANDNEMPAPPTTRRRHLGEALAMLRFNNKGQGSSSSSSAAEAYTRSLMWDEVPESVVRDFARMVAESRQQEPLA